MVRSPEVGGEVGRPAQEESDPQHPRDAYGWQRVYGCGASRLQPGPRNVAACNVRNGPASKPTHQRLASKPLNTTPYSGRRWLALGNGRARRARATRVSLAASRLAFRRRRAATQRDALVVGHARHPLSGWLWRGSDGGPVRTQRDSGVHQKGMGMLSTAPRHTATHRARLLHAPRAADPRPHAADPRPHAADPRF